jgi:DNA-binding NarL/FixJ family response regulator
VRSPADEATALARTFVGELEEWPDDAWLALDDFHLAMKSAACESFVETVLSSAPIQVIVTSRRQPRWASSRRSLYGEIHEIGQDALAFTQVEAEQLLAHIPPSRAATILERAHGWPAVLGLAARSAVEAIPGDALPEMLHRYFAEELFQAAESRLQEALIRLAILPRLIPAHMSMVLGPDAERLCADAANAGFLARGESEHYEIHPLLRTFLISKVTRTFDDLAFIDDVVDAMLTAGFWDDAFLVIEEFDRSQLVPRLFEVGLEPLLKANRLATVSTWFAFGIASGCVSPHLDLAEAELARRAGSGTVGEARALHAARGLTHRRDRYRAYVLAGSCAQLDLRLSDAATHWDTAALYASGSAETTRVLWGKFVAEIELERVPLAPIVTEIVDCHDGSLTSTIRLACVHLLHASRRGGVEREALLQFEKAALVGRDVDPFIGTLFLYVLAYTHVMSAHYTPGLAIARAALDQARVNGLDFAIPHITAAQAAANVGLRNFGASRLFIEKLYGEASSVRDRFQASNRVVLAARRSLAQRRDGIEALRLLSAPATDAPTKALQGEWLGLRALTLATLGQIDESLRAAREAESITIELQANTLAALARAIAALQINSEASVTELSHATDAVLHTQDYDNVVCAYRAYPPLLVALKQARPDFLPLLEDIMTRALDRSVAASIGWNIGLPTKPEPLSQRERQVYALMCEGLTNKEIGSSLFIAEATVKVHVRHILQKLNVRSRTEAVMKLQET